MLFFLPVDLSVSLSFVHCFNFVFLQFISELFACRVLTVYRSVSLFLEQWIESVGKSVSE